MAQNQEVIYHDKTSNSTKNDRCIGMFFIFILGGTIKASTPVQLDKHGMFIMAMLKDVSKTHTPHNPQIWMYFHEILCDWPTETSTQLWNDS